MILVDGNSLGYVAAAVNTKPTGAVSGFLKQLLSVRSKFSGRIMILWDGRSWRHSLYSEYKGSRDANPTLVALKQSWTSQKPTVVKIVTHLGVSQMMAANMEADDLAAKLVSVDRNMHTLVSGDKDWCQLVRHNVTWYDPRWDRYCSPSNLRDIVGYDNVAQFVEAKALTGDSSDNIKGVGGIGEKNAALIFETFGSVDGLLAHTGDYPNKAIRTFAESEEKQQKFKENLRLVKLDPSVIPASEKLVIVKGKTDKEAFSDMCEELAFVDLLRNADNWIDRFGTTT